LATQTHTHQGETETPLLDSNPTRAAALTPERVEEPVAVSNTLAAEAPAPQRGIISLVTNEILALNDWLGGPARTERDRAERKMDEVRFYRHTRPSGF